MAHVTAGATLESLMVHPAMAVPEQEPRRSFLGGVVCRAILSLPLAGLIAVGRGLAAETFHIDPRFGSIEFSVDHLGLFTSHGEFRRFDGTLALDFAHPERTRIDFAIDAGSVQMQWRDGAAMLRSPAYFDVRSHPTIRFDSTRVTPAGTARYVVQGLVEIRGVTRPMTLNANVTGTRMDPVLRTEVADVAVTGELRRSAFGMIEDQALISDGIGIQIHARIPLRGRRTG